MSHHNKHHNMTEKVQEPATTNEFEQEEKVTNEQEEVSEQTENNVAEVAQEENLQDKLQQLEQQCADLTDQKLRMMAEFDNYRRRTNKEKLDLMKTAGEGIFKDMLPLIDDFERALKAMQETDDITALREGIELIYNKFNSFLQKNKVEVIPTEDAVFNTEIHEAITTFPAPTEEQKGKVIECTQKGYTLDGKVIRFAKVVVGE